MALRCILIDDEEHSTQTLEVLLRKYCPEVKITGIFHEGIEALEFMATQPPDLLFLDINMPHLDGLQLARIVARQPFAVVFTTAHSHYALEAFRAGAIDYLMKPIDPADLQKAVEKAQKLIHSYADSTLTAVLEKLQSFTHAPTRIPIPTQQGIQLLEIDSIMYATSDSNYTNIITTDNRYILSKTLKDVEQMLVGHPFLRIHKSSLVHLKYLTMYVKGRSGHVVMADGKELAVAHSRKDVLLQAIYEGFKDAAPPSE